MRRLKYLQKQSLVKLNSAMAKGLDLIVVAEDIETNEQLCYLIELGYHLRQGYLYSKPLSANEIEVLLHLINCIFKADY